MKKPHEIMLMSALLVEADSVKYIDLRINEIIIGEGYKDLYVYIKGFVSEYGKLPEISTVKDKFDFTFYKPAETAEFYRDELFQAYRRKKIYDMCKQANDKSKVGEYDQAIQDLTLSISELNLINYQDDIIELSSSGLEIFQDQQNKLLLGEGIDYIPTGWDTFDVHNGGLAGGDVLSIVGRPGTGKTYLTLYIALNAWKNFGKAILYVSMEIKPDMLIQRIIAMYTGTYVSNIKKGTISSMKKKQVITQLETLEDMPNFWIVDGNLSSTVSDIENWVTELKPELVLVDGAYLLEPEQNNGWSVSNHVKIKDSCEGMKKRIAAKKDIPVVLSYQFNRESTKAKETDAGLEYIGGSDSIGQISSFVLGLFEDDNKANQVRTKKINILKGREGEHGVFIIRWLFNQQFPTMCFDEIPKLEQIADQKAEMIYV